MIKRFRSSYFIIVISLLLMPSCTSAPPNDYNHDGLEVTPQVREFIAQHEISGSDLEKVHRIIEIMHDQFLFIKIDRRQMQRWVKDQKKADEFQSHLHQLKKEFVLLNQKRLTKFLSQEEFKKRKELLKSLYFGEHNLRVFREVINRKNIYSEDLPFVVSGSEAVEYGIRDGCTTATKTFIVLAKAAGMEDIRFVPTGSIVNYNQACPQQGEPRKQDVTINGHFFALTKISGEWALVNCTYFEPYTQDESLRYEIFFELDGVLVSPEMLKDKIIQVPSFQGMSTHKKLYVIAVGEDSNDDLNIESYRTLMNMSVSGDRDCPLCKYEQFNILDSE